MKKILFQTKKYFQNNLFNKIKYSSHFTQPTDVVKDKEITDIVDYVHDFKIESQEALKVSRYTVLDAIGCGILALQYKECTK
jgi:hypothetical protein